ncbi:hypothetical protein JCM10213_005344 [Rhodosporidiobolus nylandii]
MDAPTDRKRRWDAGDPSAAGPGDNALKAVKTEEGATASAGAQGARAAEEAAAAIAARLSASYQSHSPSVPPPPSSAPPPPPPHMNPDRLKLAQSNILPPGEGGGVTSQAAQAGMRAERDRDREAGLFVEDIEINDLRNRYLLTKGPTQQQILADTGASVLTKGVWYPDKSMATEKDPPLYLHITGETPEKLTAGVAAVRALIEQGDQPGPGGPRFGGPPGGGDGGWGGRERRKWPEEKIYIELEPLRNFNIRAKTVGPGGLFVKFIQQETQTRVQIKGLGSGYIETDTGRELEEPIHINVTGPDPVMNAKAADLARDLLEVVKEKHAEAKQVLDEAEQQRRQQQMMHGQQQPQQQMYGQPLRFGADGGMGQNAYSYQPGQFTPGLTAPLPPGEAPPPPPGGADASATPAAGAPAGGDPSGQMSTEAYTAWWNSLDAASQAYYTQYYAAYAAYTQNPGAAAAPGAAPGAAPAPPSSAPPPPPPSDAPPPPPPADEGPKGGAGTYGAVPPPPGL